MGDFKKAEESINQTLKFFNNDLSAAYDRIAYTYSFFDMYKEAEYYCKEAININPTEPGLHYNLALIYSAQEQYKFAKDELRKVLELPVKKQYKRYKKYASKNIKEIDKKIIRNNEM